MTQLQNIMSWLVKFFVMDLSKMETDKKKKTLCFCFFFLAILSWSNQVVKGWELRYAIITIIGCMILYVIIALLKPAEGKNDKVSIMQCACWIMMSIFMIASALIHRIDNLLLPFLLLFIFPFVWFVIRRLEDKSILFESMSKGFIASFLVFFVLSLLFAPITKHQYSGLFYNCNATAFYVIVLLSCTIYMVNKTKKRCYYIFIALECDIMFFTRSRTGMLSMIVIFAAWIFMELRQEFLCHAPKEILKRFMMIVLLTVVFFPAFWGVNRIAMHTIQQKFCLNAYEELMDRRHQSIFDVSFSYMITGIGERVSSEGKDLNIYSGKRINIWKGFLKELNWTGHSASNEEFSIGYNTAHNVYLQIAYDYGVVAGIIFGINTVMLSLGILLNAWKHYNCENLLSLLLMIGYNVIALLASSVYPFLYLITFCFYVMSYQSFDLRDKNVLHKNGVM
ncbi:MAG: O-antigen ligase family protein [Candidatus Gastranaerophilales bacterium]|nr:O-antigen ligase family protein [Candidatus Gastranaerophilales bacterium]